VSLSKSDKAEVAKALKVTPSDVDTAIQGLLKLDWFARRSGQRRDPLNFTPAAGHTARPISASLNRQEFDALTWRQQLVVIVDHLGYANVTVTVDGRELSLRKAIESEAALTSGQLAAAGVMSFFGDQIAEALKTGSAAPMGLEQFRGQLSAR
jgi:hypothetical protein